MRGRDVKTLLFLTILVMTVMPLAAAFYFLDRSLQTSLNLGFNPQMLQVLEQGAENLKTLRRLDPEHRENYRSQFAQIADLQHIYANPELVKGTLRNSLMIYFGIGLAAAALLSVAVATFLSRRIAREYAVTFEELARQRDKVRYLEEISSWQELAKMLAHEIKNPLTPIEVLITSLSKSYLSKNSQDFQEQLRQTETMVGEELGHLKSIVDRFSEFSRLPQVELATASVVDVLAQQSKAIGPSFANADIQLDMAAASRDIPVRIDALLFRQVMANLVRNGVEANPDRRVRFTVQVASKQDSVCIAISNDGDPVPHDIAPRIFDPYISSKSAKQNMGLGLAIVKKIVIEHGGEIAYAERDGRPVFAITLPVHSPGAA
jgi:signal transduction histidine kinase